MGLFDDLFDLNRDGHVSLDEELLGLGLLSDEPDAECELDAEDDEAEET